MDEDTKSFSGSSPHIIHTHVTYTGRHTHYRSLPSCSAFFSHVGSCLSISLTCFSHASLLFSLLCFLFPFLRFFAFYGIYDIYAPSFSRLSSFRGKVGREDVLSGHGQPAMASHCHYVVLEYIGRIEDGIWDGFPRCAGSKEGCPRFGLPRPSVRPSVTSMRANSEQCARRAMPRMPKHACTKAAQMPDMKRQSKTQPQPPSQSQTQHSKAR